MTRLLNITTFSVSIAVGIIGLVSVFAWVYLLDTLLTVTTLALWAIGGFVVVATGAGAFGVVVWAMGLYARASEQARRERLASEEYAAAVAAKWRDVHMPQITVAEPGSQVYQTEINRMSITRPLHLAPGMVNGYDVKHSDPELSRWQQWNLMNATGSKPPELEAPSQLTLEAPPPPPLLPILERAQRVLIVGASNAGKTTLLQHFIEQRRSFSQILVIDPHGSPPKWGSVPSVGAGRDYTAILGALDSLIQLMTDRYDQIGRGEATEGSHPLLTVVIDEWRAIVKACKDIFKEDAGQRIGALLTEARKAGIWVCVATHSERVKGLGIDGESDLRDGFDVVRLRTDGSTRRAFVVTPDGEAEHTLPGEFMGRTEHDSQVLLLPPPPTPEEKQILEMLRQGESRYKICKTLWGSTGGVYYRRIEETCRKFGISTEDATTTQKEAQTAD